MGSVCDSIVRHAHCPVLVVRGGEGTWPPSRIVVGEDGSVGARQAAHLAASMGTTLRVEVILVRAHPVVLPMPEASRHSRSSAIGIPQDVRAYHEVSSMERTDQLRDELGYRPRFMVIGGEPASVLLEVAEGPTGSSLISVGRRGLRLLDRLRLGSVSTKLLRASTAPLLVSPP
jgi:nucleotide-binding universal stress UspA family protein